MAEVTDRLLWLTWWVALMFLTVMATTLAYRWFLNRTSDVKPSLRCQPPKSSQTALSKILGYREEELKVRELQRAFREEIERSLRLAKDMGVEVNVDGKLDMFLKGHELSLSELSSLAFEIRRIVGRNG